MTGGGISPSQMLRGDLLDGRCWWPPVAFDESIETFPPDTNRRPTRTAGSFPASIQFRIV